MKHINELESRLNDYLGWNKARVNCLTKILLGLLKVNTVNLRKIATVFESDRLVDSRYKRLQRFFAQMHFDQSTLAVFLLKQFFTAEEKVYLTIDRTNWFVGKKPINILMLGVAYEGAAIPLFWKLLDHSGNATAEEHRSIVEEFIETFGKERIEAVLADREFGNKGLCSWLSDEEIPFYIRVKSSLKGRYFCEKGFRIDRRFKSLRRGESMIERQPIEVFNKKLFLAGAKNERDELLIVATNSDVRQAIPRYHRRWEIETLFQCLKGRGFSFEETHLTQRDRIATLMGLLAIAFVWAHKVGEWHATIRPIQLKRFSNGQRRTQYSYFRYGLDFLSEVLVRISSKKREINRLIKLLFPPPESLKKPEFRRAT